MLDILREIDYDNSISKIEYRSYLPYNDNSFNNNDEIRININNLNFVQLSDSFLHFELKVAGTTPVNSTMNICKNFIPFLFSEIKLEMNSVLIDSIKSPGISSTIMNYLSMTPDEKNASTQYSWDGEVKTGSSRDFVIPLRKILNFAEDYKKLIIFSRLELVLIRARHDSNIAVKGLVAGEAAPEIRIKIDKLRWIVPHIYPEESVKLKLLKVLENGKQISLPFRKIEFHENPGIPATTELSWQVKSSIVRPLYVLIGLQTARKDNIYNDSTKFDHCSLRNCRLYLNSDVFPYEQLNLDFNNNKFGIAYEMMQDCRKSLFDLDGLALSREEFLSNAPLICFNVSNFTSHLKNAFTDIKCEFEFVNAPAAQTTINMLIISEEIINYNPFTNIVQKN